MKMKAVIITPTLPLSPDRSIKRTARTGSQT